MTSLRYSVIRFLVMLVRFILAPPCFGLARMTDPNEKNLVQFSNSDDLLQTLPMSSDNREERAGRASFGIRLRQGAYLHGCENVGVLTLVSSLLEVLLC